MAGVFKSVGVNDIGFRGVWYLDLLMALTGHKKHINLIRISRKVQVESVFQPKKY